MCIFKKYKDIFGKPNEGVHAIRFMDIAIIDLIFTIIGAIIISYFMKQKLIIILILLLIIGEIAHILFGVETKIINILKYIFHF